MVLFTSSINSGRLISTIKPVRGLCVERVYNVSNKEDTFFDVDWATIFDALVMMKARRLGRFIYFFSNPPFVPVRKKI